jgi:hypothetical protein
MALADHSNSSLFGSGVLCLMLCGFGLDSICFEKAQLKEMNLLLLWIDVAWKFSGKG